MDEKWKGAPFAAMVRVHNADRFDIGETVLHMAVIISNEVSSPMYVKYSSILLQVMINYHSNLEVFQSSCFLTDNMLFRPLI